jgi:patatin-like phospholipase/acyl hydrolase
MATYRILSLDGGGIRGIVTAALLERLDAEVPGWRDEIDLFAGTSTGGILALGLAHGLSPADLRQLYESHGGDIFDDSWLDDLRDLGKSIGADYDNRKLARLLRANFGDALLKDLRRKVLIPSFDLDNEADEGKRSWKPKIFHNFGGGDSDGIEPVYKVALYTSAAPTFFPSVDGFVDGGVYANNPSMCALAQTQDKRALRKPPALSDIRLLSLGTGTSLTYIQGRELDWGYAQWVKPLINILMDGVSGIADYQCFQLLGDGYHRLAPTFPAGTTFELDDVERIPQMLEFARRVAIDDAVAWLQSEWT